jgi:hypothetical protein
MIVRSYLYDFPAGTKATFAGKTETVRDKKPLVQNADFSDKVAALTLDDVQRKRVDVEIPLVIDYPGRGQIKLKTPPLRIAHAVAHELARAEKEPVRFAGEKADAGKPDTVAVVRVRSRSRRMRVLGDGKTVSDVDWVAIERTHGEPRKFECPRPGKKPRILKLTDLEVAIFERLSAKAVETKVFEAKPQCTPLGKGEKGPKSQRELIDDWLRAKLGLPNAPEQASTAAAPTAKALVGKPVSGSKPTPAPPAQQGASAPAKVPAPTVPKPAAPTAPQP